MKQVCLTLSPQEAADNTHIQKAAARELQLPSAAICGLRIVKRSVDARQRDIKILLTVQVALTAEEATLPPYELPIYPMVANAPEVHIIGAGPAGLFAALTLIEHGLKPVIFERGKDVSERKVDIASLNKNEGISAESNYCFGEGGAGTFSDGKLFSRSKKRGNMQRVMELFHFFGANDGVLYEAHAHIGSDKLPSIIRRMRECILEHGGKIHFNSRVDSLDLTIPTILAIGHSAHDSYRMLAQSGVQLEPKGFALGVRVEHPQPLIDDLMYHHSPLRGQGLLPAASYSLVTQVRNEYGQRGVYSFCMCPGGHIVPAGSTPESGIVNGMSASHRNSPFANSGIVVELHPDDLLADSLPADSNKTSAFAVTIPQQEIPFKETPCKETPYKETPYKETPYKETHCKEIPYKETPYKETPYKETPYKEIPYKEIRTINDPLSTTEAALRCLEWQEHVEHLSWEHGAKEAGHPESAIAPAQRLRDFVEGHLSDTLPLTSYLPGCHSSRLDKWLPEIIGKSLQQGFRDFDRKYPGYLTNQAVILGVESRSSSPVRIPRDSETLQAYGSNGQLLPLYPAGEGAGYAGGITSSALDGINAALAIAKKMGK